MGRGEGEGEIRRSLSHASAYERANLKVQWNGVQRKEKKYFRFALVARWTIQQPRDTSSKVCVLYSEIRFTDLPGAPFSSTRPFLAHAISLFLATAVRARVSLSRSASEPPFPINKMQYVCYLYVSCLHNC